MWRSRLVRPRAHDWKSCIPQGIEGSNPSFSATARPKSKVTIKDISELADVNRGTFYKHYADQNSLLYEIQEELDFEIKATLEKKLTHSSANTELIEETFRCIAAQSSLCKVLCCDYGDGEFLKRLMYNAHD